MKAQNFLSFEREATHMRATAQGFAVTSGFHSFKTVFRRFLGGMVALALVAAIVPAADAAVYTRFDSEDVFSEKWGGDSTDKKRVSITDGPDGEKALRLFRGAPSQSSNDNAFVYYKGTEDGIVGGKVADFELTTTFSVVPPGTSTSAFGIMIRAQDVGFDNAVGYYVSYRPTDGGSLVLSDSPVSHANYGPSLTSAEVSLSSGSYYVLKISAVGSTISASVWSEDESTLLASLTYEGARTDAGYFGIRSGFQNSADTAMYVKDISVTVIPEPAAIAFSILGGVALMILRRRQG